LVGRLALAVDHLRKAEAHAAVGVDGGVTKLGERQVRELPDGIVHRRPPSADAFEEPSEPRRVHARPQTIFRPRRKVVRPAASGRRTKRPESGEAYTSASSTQPLCSGRHILAIISAGPSPTSGTECSARTLLSRATASSAAEKTRLAASRSATS